jgi:hypothetical protein
MSERKIPKVRHVILNHAGLCWSEYLVALPSDAIMQDITDHPSMMAGHKLRENDQLRIVAHDRSWACQAVVIEAGPDRCVVSKPTKLWSGADARGVVYADKLYEVRWNGASYEVWRRATDRAPAVMLATGLATEGTARRELANQYPRVA